MNEFGSELWNKAASLFEPVKEIQGWGGDGAHLFLMLSEIQRQHGYTGAIAEIGVLHGKFFILLCKLLSGDEQAIAIDVFENQDFNIDQSGMGVRLQSDHLRPEFEDNVDRHLAERSHIHVLQKDSLQLVPSDVLSRTGLVRIFSVDGCHTRQHTINDIVKAEGCLAPGGLILVDDFTNPDFPGVRQAVDDVLADPARSLKALIFGYNKIALCRADDEGVLRQAILDKLEQMPNYVACQKIESDRVIPFITPEPPYRTTALPLWNACLESGFSIPEEWGCWTVGPQAEVSFTITSGAGNDAACLLKIRSSSYVPQGQISQLTRLYLNQHPLGEMCGTGDEQNFEYSLAPQLLNIGRNVLRFEPLRPMSPAQDGVSGDSRVLGMRLIALGIFQTEDKP